MQDSINKCFYGDLNFINMLHLYTCVNKFVGVLCILDFKLVIT